MEQPGVTIPPSASEPPPKKKRFLLKSSIIATLLVFGYFVWQCGSGLSAGAHLSDEAVRYFHAQLDAAADEQILGESDERFQSAGTHQELLDFLTGVHTKLGQSQTSTRQTVFVNATPGGTFIRVGYESQFEKGKATEQFVWVKKGAGLKLVGYHINSNVFLK